MKVAAYRSPDDELVELDVWENDPYRGFSLALTVDEAKLIRRALKAAIASVKAAEDE